MKLIILVLIILHINPIFAVNKNVKNNISMAIQAENRNDFKDAIRLYSKVLNDTIDKEYKLEILNNIGVLHFKLNHYEEALKTFTECLRLNGKDARIWNNLGISLVKTNSNIKALEAFKKAININPIFIESYINIINIYYKNSKYNEALEYSKKLLKIEPFFSYALYCTGLINLKLKHIDKAISYFEASLIQDPYFELSLFKLSNIYFEKKDREKFISTAVRLVEIEPNEEILIALGYTFYEKNFYNKAIEYLNKALFVSPGNINALKIIETVYEKIKDWENALIIRKKINKQSNLDFDKEFKIAVYLYNLSRYKEAIKVYNNLITKYGSNKKVLLNLSLAYFAVGDYEKGKNVLIKHQNDLSFSINIAWADLRLKNYKKAYLIFKKLNKKYPKNLRIQENMYLSLIYLKKFDVSYKGLIKLREKILSPYVSLYLCWLYLLKGEINKALNSFEEALNLDLNHELSFNNDIEKEPAFFKVKNNSDFIKVIKSRFFENYNSSYQY